MLNTKWGLLDSALKIKTPFVYSAKHWTGFSSSSYFLSFLLGWLQIHRVPVFSKTLQQTHTHTLRSGWGVFCKQAGRGQHPQYPQYRVGRIFYSSSGLGVIVQTLIPSLCCWIHTDRRPECRLPQETHHRRFAICAVSSISGCQLPAGYQTVLCSLCSQV